MTSPTNESKCLIDAIDRLAEAESLVECAFMAAQGLSRDECGAIQTVLDVAKQRIEHCKGQLYAIHGGEAA